MPFVTVDIDADDVLPELSDADLQEELDRRRKTRGGSKAASEAHPWTDLGLAEDLRTAFYARNANRFEALLAQMDPTPRIAGGTATPIGAARA
jgi:hypothetical protein